MHCSFVLKTFDYNVIPFLFPAAASLQRLLSPFLLRRVKSDVMKDLPKKSEVVLFHGLTALQKKYYKAVLTKDQGVNKRIINCVNE